MKHCPCPVLDVFSAVRCLKDGGVIVYPTETFYALGCLAANAPAVEGIYRLKRRSLRKKLPLVAADYSQAATVASFSEGAQRLATQFWPGPLSLLVPVRNTCGECRLPEYLINAQGAVAIRVSGSSLARKLAFLAGGPLTASSANVSGNPPAAEITALDEDVLSALSSLGLPAGLLPPPDMADGPAGGKSSTIVEPLTLHAVRVVREGAVSIQSLKAAGFSCLV